MSKVIEIAISESSGKVMKNVDSIESIAGKGLLNDRYFKEDNKKGLGGYNYSTGMELVLTGLGSTSSPLKGRIENKIPGYTASLR